MGRTNSEKKIKNYLSSEELVGKEGGCHMLEAVETGKEGGQLGRPTVETRR